MTQDYLLANSDAELERLTLQARVWQAEAEAMLDEIGIRPGMQCVDLGCGAMGILQPLSRRVGPEGKVLGVDTDLKQLAAARRLIEIQQLGNTEIRELDAYASGLPDNAFDLTHVRFVFAPVGRDDELMRELIRMTRPGGFVAIQEPDATSWNCFPQHPAWHTLKKAILTAFEQGGGDFNAGQRLHAMMSEAGLEDIHVRAAVIALQNCHPYMRSPLQFAVSLRPRIVGGGLLTEDDLTSVVKSVEEIVGDPKTVVLTFTVMQVWGRKPA